MTALDRDHFLEEAHKRQNPSMVARLTVLRAASAKLQRDGRLLIKELQKTVGATSQEAAGISTADEQARAALRIEPSA